MITHNHGSGPLAAGQATPGRPPWRGRLRTMSRRARVGAVSAVAAVIAAVAVILIAAQGQAPQAAPPPVARSFSLPALGQPGTTITLASYAGRPLIVNFFASWCAPCQRETPLLARYYESHSGHVIVIGIDANDQQAAALKFIAKAGVRYPVGWDPFPASVTTSYGVYGLPQTFFLNAQHRVVARVLGAVTARVLARDVALMNRQASQDRG